MSTAKDILVKPIDSKSANAICKKFHYSGKVVPNSQIHFGVFLNGKCEGVMQFGPSFMKKKLSPLVSGTGVNQFIELNRMAFGPVLPKNSESRALSIAHKIIKKTYPHIGWIVSFADATQCGDGTIYRASGYILTGIKKNSSMIKLPDGKIVASMTYTKGKHILKQRGRASVPSGSVPLPGYMLRYVYFLRPELRKKLTVKEIPFDEIPEEVKMYKGKKRGEHESNAL